MSATIYALITEVLERGDSAVLCTVTRAEGSTPRHVGSKMLVYENGTTAGSVGGGELEHRVTKEALRLFANGKPRLVSYTMANPARGDPGVCGGQVDVLVEPILPPAKVLIVGGGHVGKAVAHLAKWLGFRVAVSDDRIEFCNAETIPDGDEFYPVPMAELPLKVKINPQTFVVLTTRASSVDVDGLPALLGTQAAYIGVIGSRRRWATTVKGLKERGIPARQLANVHAPIGLELNAETPAEIAVSIMAEIIMLRANGSGKPMKISKAELAGLDAEA